MVRVERPAVLILSLLLLFAISPAVPAREMGAAVGAKETLDSIDFVKMFHIGMTYAEVQQSMPKTLEQDTLSYNAGENVFMLSVDSPASESWSAYFIFDTGDATMRRPEHLVELSCSLTLKGRSEPFESVVEKVSRAFGEPIGLDSAKGPIRQAGWRVSSESVLTVEYTVVQNQAGGAVIDFLIKGPKKAKSESQPIA
jgi:hypothetical protein